MTTPFASKGALGELLKSWAPSYQPYAGMFDLGICSLAQLANVDAETLAKLLANVVNQTEGIQHRMHAEDIILRAAKSGAGRVDSSLATVPEDRIVTFKDLAMLKNKLSRQLLDIKLQLKATGSTTGESQTTLGQQIQQAARRASLVTVTDDHKKASKAWLKKADLHVRQTWQRAQLEDSQLSEDEVQDAVSKLICCQPETFLHKLHDTHKKPSVCGPLMPDVVGCTPGKMLPVNTTILLELKSQERPFNTPAHISQIAEYAHSALNKLPRHRRTKILTALSDLKSIVFLMVERSPDGTWTYHLDERCEDQVLPALCAVLSMSPDELGAGCLPELSLATPGTTPAPHLTIVDWLGSGATADVYKVELPGASPAVTAAKVMRRSSDPVDAALLHSLLEQERAALEQLHAQLPGSLAVPKVIGRLQGQQEGQPIHGLMLQPVGTLLTRETLEQLQAIDVGAAIAGVVKVLRAAHSRCGLAHCDVRPDNLMIVQGPEGDGLMLSDWGCSRSISMCVAAKDYCGTSKFASDAVLEALAQDQPVTVEPADDLQSLAKSCFFLTRGPTPTAELVHLDKSDYKAILRFWQQQLRDKQQLRSVLEAARQLDYEGVTKSLAAKLE